MRKASCCFLVLLIFTSISYLGCSGPGGPGDLGPSEDHDILPPGQVEVKVAGNDPILTWASVSGAEAYVIFRKQGSGGYDTGRTVSATTFTDTGALASGAASFQYAVASYAGGKRSVLSTPTGVVYVNVPGVWASRFEYADKVVLDWNRHDTAVSYKIYRTKDPTSSVAPDCMERVTPFGNQGALSWVNTATSPAGHTAEAGTPYYYRVTWIDSSGTEHGANDAPYSMGIFGGEVDYGEPDNNDYMNLSASDAIDPDHTPTPLTGYLYNVYDGSKDRVDDDWFRIKDPDSLLKITVQVDITGAQTDFEKEELKFAVRYGSSGTTEELSTNGVSSSGKITYTLDYGPAGIDSDNVDVYFLLSTKTTRSSDLFGKYTITFTCN